MFFAWIALAGHRSCASALFSRLCPSGFSAGGIDLNDIFGNLSEGKPKTIYYRLFPASHASPAWHFSQAGKNFTARKPASECIPSPVWVDG